MLWVIMAVVLLIVIWAFYAPQVKTKSREQQLLRQYRRLLRMPEQEADAVIVRQLAQLKDRHPGQTDIWYLEKMLFELERDR